MTDVNVVLEHIGTVVLATGALGTAAFGIVEALKWTRLGIMGFGAIERLLGPLLVTYKVAYGPDWRRLLRAQYRGERSELTRVLRQGVRIGLTPDNAGELAKFVGTVSAEDLKTAASRVHEGEDLPDELRNVLGRFELAVDSRIDAALALSQEQYAGAARTAAMIVALSVAIITAAVLSQPGGERYYWLAVLIGLAAVPIAPIAKDLVTALQSASVALRGK
jgi:hypothetical protein